MKFLLPALILFFSFPPESEVERMPWSERNTLTWEDFQGTPEAVGNYVASTNSGISFSYSFSRYKGELDLEYTVRSNFYPQLSWYLPERVNDYILKHEQTHFDISELFARKLRKRLSETVFSEDPKPQIEAIYKQIEKERRAMQEQFDEESDHSKIVEGELQWERFVKEELQRYGRWK
ncbi:MAG: DUF922 domain-containing protein [Flavobacteriaceae bacterium]|nr:DUF922 domain-containing protein [Flavobacteriaceae bacterium]|tara:strand:- start:10723 stop:11256 length:534 start_codon:yes stop_codon:yes gene_type:complete